MSSRHAAFLLVVLSLPIAACGGVSETVDDTVAVVEPIRGALALAGETQPVLGRASIGQTISIGAGAALARVRLDEGPRALIGDGATITVDEPGHIVVAANGGPGRAFIEIAEGERLDLGLGAAWLRAADASFSIAIDTSSVYVVSGEVSYSKGAVRGVAHAGETLALAGEPAVTPTALWEDWTGGLARPGPETESSPDGVGSLEARVPGETGKARWPLVVRRLDVHVEIVNDLALTEIDQVFFNPASETVEGIYRVRVPGDAVLQRFAVDRNGRLVDGYVREKAQARQAYDAQVYQGSTDDPALLEWNAPGAYEARIYPIPAGATRRIVVRYAEWLSRPREGAARLYRYPLGGGTEPPHVQEFSFAANLAQAGAASIRAGAGARVEGHDVVLRRSDFRPRADLFIELVDAEPAAGITAYRAGHEPPPRAPGTRAIPNEADERDYYYVPVVVPASVIGQAPPGIDLVIVADVSAATAASDLELGRSVVESLVAHLGADDRVAIVTSDLRIRSLEGGDAPALGPAAPDRIEAMLEELARAPGGGATDLGAAITDATTLLDETRNGAVVYVGDGAPTVGELDADALLEHVARMPRPTRLYAVAVGDGANLDLLEALSRGGGLAERVEQRADSAEAALRILAHAARPLAQRVTVELGTGIDNVFPRRPVDVVVGETLQVLGRVRGSVPTVATVKGTIFGREFSVELPIVTHNSANATDLRLRWANERLRQLLLEGASREEVAELGTRYGLITPFTSYYVPSARELGLLGMNEPETLDALARREARAPLLTGPLAMLALAGCTDRAREANRTATREVAEEMEGELAPSAEAPDEPAATEQHAAQNQAAPSAQPNEPPPYPAQVAAPSADDGQGGEATRRAAAEEAAVDALVGDQVGQNFGLGGLGLRGTGAAGTPTSGATSPTTTVPADLDRGRGSDVTLGEPRARAPRARDPEAPLDGPEASQRDTAGFRYEPTDGNARENERDHRGIRMITTTTIVFDSQAHAARRCSDAARLSLDDRRSLFRERLAAVHTPGEWMDAFGTAVRDCEADTWRDKRALLDLVLARAGNIQTMIQTYHTASSASVRGYLRSAIIRRVRTPDDLRAVRQAFGLAAEVDWALVQRLVDEARTPVARIRVLRQLITQYPYSFDLRLRLLEELERNAQLPEARRLAAVLRRDPLADAGVRTAIGELYLRIGDEAEARRVFSEIVEFAPLDALARRRLGDLYRAHEWYEEAYRQYQTLATIRPDDPSVYLLLAQAAAGAGRIDEALRLEQRLAETAQPGGASGVARTAILWSSVRFAKLRKEAAGDATELATYLARMRRSGVLREASQLRASLTWSHPDAGLSLWAAYPNLRLSRPTDIAPEFGIEAFDVKEVEAGVYKLEVRRSGRDLRTPVTAELVLVWNEGTPDEKIEVIPMRFEGETRALAWTLSDRTVAQGTISPEATRGAL